MSNRARQFDVTHALSTHLGQGHFHATLLTDYTAMLEALVLSAQTLVVLHWAKDLGAEQTVTLWFESSVVNGLWFLNFTKRPRPNHLWRCQTDANGIKLI